MSKWTGQGSPDCRIGASFDEAMDVMKAAAEAEANASKTTEHIITRRNRERRMAQNRLDGRKTYG